MKFLVFLTLLFSFQLMANDPTPTPAPIGTTRADQIVNDASTEVQTAGKRVKKALNKAAGKIENKVNPPADNTPKGTKP